MWTGRRCHQWCQLVKWGITDGTSHHPDSKIFWNEEVENFYILEGGEITSTFTWLLISLQCFLSSRQEARTEWTRCSLMIGFLLLKMLPHRLEWTKNNVELRESDDKSPNMIENQLVLANVRVGERSGGNERVRRILSKDELSGRRSRKATTAVEGE